VVAKDTLPEATAQKELHLRPRHWKSQGTGDSGPEPSGCKLTESLEDSMVCKIKDREARPITVQLHINGNPLTMEVDTGAAFP